MTRLHCYSFHSVKGGVGKSTLASFLAHGLAAEMPTTLVDMDLTGTSLSDVLPLRAPRWSGNIDLTRPPDGFHDRGQTVHLIHERGYAPVDQSFVEPPFLNDFLLHVPADRETDVDVRALGWAIDKGHERLRVIPSSAQPRDLERIMPVIFDEERAGFLEGRLEYLLDGLARTETEQAVVFDTPPTIPGLSRAVLSLALRLRREPKLALADDDFIPHALHTADISWTAFLVVTLDLQDLRAANRWLDLVDADDEDALRVVFNRVKPDIERERVSDELSRRLYGHDPLRTPRGPDTPAVEEVVPSLLRMRRDPVPVHVNPALEFFGSEALPPELAELLADLRS